MRAWSLKVLVFTIAAMFFGQKGFTQFTSEFFAKNVAIVDATERSINEREFVRQIKIIILEGSQTPPIAMGNGEYGFLDNGKEHDLVAGDGIYTTVNTFPHTEQNPYNEELLEKSVLPAAIVNKEFAHRDALQEYLNENPPPGKTEGLEISVECDVEWCACKSKCGGCIVQMGAVIGCVPCPKFSNCKFKIIWSPF